MLKRERPAMEIETRVPHNEKRRQAGDCAELPCPLRAMNPSQFSHSDTCSPRLADLLLNIEAELRRLGLWDTNPPEPQALRSTQPFCFDTLTLGQWLQWIFLPRMKRLLEEGGELPGKSEILPLAEEAFRDFAPECRTLLKYIGEFDALINARSQG